MMHRRLLAALLAVVLVGGGTTWWVRARERPAPGVLRHLTPRPVTAPTGVRIRVEVVNTTRVRGLARRATLFLRDRGFDVVVVSTGAGALDSTLVLDRSGHPEWARLVAAALGGARVESRPDSSRYLDVTVLLGASWRPPPQPFHP